MDMPSLSISKAPHPRLVDLLVPILPGGFFLGSLLWAHPALFAMISERHSNPLVKVALALFSAYFAGSAVLVFINCLQIMMRAFYWKYLRLKRQVAGHLHSALVKASTKHSWAKTKIVRRYVKYLGNYIAVKDRWQQAASQVWAASSRRLLKVGYGIEPPIGTESRDQWSMWYEVLGTLTLEDLRGGVITKSVYGSGILGLVARYSEPNLHNRIYLFMSITFIAIGLFNDRLYAKRWADPVGGTLLRVKSILREIKPLLPDAVDDQEPIRE